MLLLLHGILQSFFGCLSARLEGLGEREGREGQEQEAQIACIAHCLPLDVRLKWPRCCGPGSASGGEGVASGRGTLMATAVKMPLNCLNTLDMCGTIAGVVLVRLMAACHVFWVANDDATTDANAGNGMNKRSGACM